MKRSDALAALSRDHHRALVVAVRLIRAGAGEREDAARRFVTFMRREAHEHFRIEEQVLLPAVPLGDGGAALVAEVLDDHRALREAGERLGAERGRPPKLDDLHALGRRLQAHVRLEERRLFPLLEDTLSAEELVALGERVEAAEHAR